MRNETDVRQCDYLVIPAYEPDERLVELVRRAYFTEKFRIIVVNDGSTEAYDPIFKQTEAYAVVLKHPVNCGKGRALKTAFQYIEKNRNDENGIVVTADADGQHSLSDILSIAEYSRQHHTALVLGQRTFQGDIPLKSRLGNKITRCVYHLESGCNVRDTQTGLRAFSTDVIPFMLEVAGERYEYEMNVLIFWAKEKRTIREIPIETIYVDGNKSSHFRPVQDAYRIYKDLFCFGGVSFLSFILDFVLYSVLTAVLPAAPALKIFLANTIARVLSSGFNFEMNRRYVFQKKDGVLLSGLEYLSLAFCIYVLSTSGITILYSIFHTNLYFLKICVDFVLFFVSWYVQKHVIFRKKEVVS